MELDFKTLKRKDLQRLCKKHGLRANSTNSQMADSLASLFKNCEENKQMKVPLGGSGKISGKEGESIEGNAEKVLIVLDEEDDEHDPILSGGVKKYSSSNSGSTEKNEQVQAGLEDSGVNGDNEGAKVQWYEENSIIFVDEEDYEPDPFPRNTNVENGKSASEVCEPENTNVKNELVGCFEIPKEDLIDPITRCSSMDTNIVQVPITELKKTKREREISQQNAELPSDTSKDDDTSVEINRETLLLEESHPQAKKKRTNGRNSSMEVDDEVVNSLDIDVSDADNLVVDEVHKKHSSTRMKFDFTLLIDEVQATHGFETKNEQDAADDELCTDENLLPLVSGTFGTTMPQKRTREILEIDIPVMLKEIDELGGTQHREFVNMEEPVREEVDFVDSQLLVNGVPSNLASSKLQLLLSELKDGRDEEVSDANEPLRKHINESLELEESLVCKNSLISSIIMMEAEDISGRRLASLELNHVSKGEEASKQSSPSSLSYSQDNYSYESQSRCSISSNHVRISEDSCETCFIADEHNNRSSGTSVLMNGFCSPSRLECEALESTDVNVWQACLDSNEVGGNSVDKTNEIFKENQYHKEKLNGSECQEDCGERISGNCDFEKDSHVTPQNSMVDDNLARSSPSERTEDMNNNVGLLVSIERHDQVGREEFQGVLQKKEDVKSLAVRFCEALEGCSSTELDELTKNSKIIGNDVLALQGLGDLGMSGDKFEEQTEDCEQDVEVVSAAALTPIMKMVTDSSDGEHNLELKELYVFGNSDTIRKASAEADNDLCGIHMTSSFELEHEFNTSLSSGKEKIYQKEIVSHLTEDSSNHFGTVLNEQDESSAARDHIKNFPGSPDLKMHSSFSSPLDAEEIRDSTFPKTKQYYKESTAEDCEVKEIGSNSSLKYCGSEAKKNTATYEGENFCGSEEPPQAVPGHDEDSKANIFTGSSPEKVVEIGPLGLSKRVDTLMEKMLCLRKVLRGEITPPVTDSSLLYKEEISHKECHLVRKKELLPELEVVETLKVASFVHKDCELNSTDPEVNSSNKIDEIAITRSRHELQENLEQWNCMGGGVRNDTAGESCQDCHVDVRKLSDIAEGGSPKPEEYLEKTEFVSPRKEVCIALEGDRNSSASCKLKMEALEEVAITAIASSPDVFQGKPGLSKCMESFEANNDDSIPNFECDFSHSCAAEGEPRHDDDVNVRGELDIVQYATPTPVEDLKKGNFLSPSKRSIDFEGERNACSNFISKKTKQNNSPAEDINHIQTQCLSKSSDNQLSLAIQHDYDYDHVHVSEMELQDCSISRINTSAGANPSIASDIRNIEDPIEEISHRLIKLCISSSQKATNINNNTSRKSTATFKFCSSIGITRNKENTQSTKKKYPSSKSKIRNTASAGSIRRPLGLVVTNQMLD